MRKILILPLFSLLVVVLSLLPIDAHAATDELKDQSSCQSIGGTWTSNNSTCAITSGLTTFDTWQIDKGVTLQVNSGVNLLVETTTTGSANYGIYNNGGTINNYGHVVVSGTYLTAIYNNVGTINNYGYIDAAAAYSGGTGIENTGTNTVFGTINNVGTMIGDSGFFGIDNTPGNTLNNAGTMDGTGSLDGIVSGGIINNAGAMSGISSTPSIPSNYGIGNSGTINDYCGVTLSGSYNGPAPNNISCYNVSFSQTGIPTSGVTWGVTASWGPFISSDNTGTGTSITLQATGPLTYSYDTPIRSSGTSYGCGSECSGSATITGATTFAANYVVVVPTSTSVSCSPPSVSAGSPSTCTATVTGNNPTGTVTFSTSTGDTSQFSSNTCSLSSGSCQVTYTPSSSTSPVTITGSYGGDFGNLPSSGTSSLTVSESGTTTAVSCSPTTGAGSPSTCTATVTGNNPTGTVTFSTSTGDTSQFSSNTCSLSSSSCQVTYTPSSSASPVTITGSYGGDFDNLPSSGTFSLIIGIVITTSNGATVCPVAPLSGTWSGDTCAVSGTVNIPSGMNLDIGSGVTISISSSGSSFAILTSGNINNNGTVTGSSGSYYGIFNHGTINNYGTMTGSSGTIYNGITNFDTINNYGTMTGSSSSSNGIVNSGGIINNTGKMSGTGGGAGIEFISGTINNNGTLSGTGGTFGFLNGATINNAGSITGSGSSFDIYNSIGTIKNECGGTVNGKITGNTVVNLCNKIPPTLTVTSPSNNTETNSNTLTVSGTASDAVAVSSITWDVDSGPVSTAAGTTSWSFNTGTLPDGVHTIYIMAANSGGLVTQEQIVITVDTTPPVIAPISDQTVEATGQQGAVATFTATATDNIDGTDPVTCTPASGSTFALGTTTVTCNSHDAAGNVAIPVTFTIAVQDTMPPVLTLPSDITQEATGPSGNVVTYGASATDLVDGPVTPTCTPASGSTFPVATTTVTCTTTDAHHNTASGTFKVIIQDTTPPAITVTDINAKATGPQTPVTFSPTATDIVDGTDPVTCTPASGSTFPLGTSTVNCSSTDAHHNTATALFTVTVAETTAPSITLPADIVQGATGPAGNVVTFAATATDLVDGTDPVTCTPASGSTFPLGSTTVTCASTNHAGNTATGTFHVVIQDTTPPTLTIQSPANDATVNTATVPVSGTASDNVQVASVSWKADSGPVSAASGTTSWSFTTGTLSTGLHTIYVNATDEAGNIAMSSISITYVAPTATLPPPSGGTTPITFSSSTGGFTSLNSIAQSSLPTPPPSGNYPLGFFSWSITGFAPASSVTVTITSPTTLYPQSHYFKLVNGDWVSIPVSVSGNTMTMTISDNGPFDGNPAVGVISDPGAVANPTDGRVTGGGTLGKNIDFTFEARSDVSKTDNTHGTLEFHDKSGGITLHSDRVSFLSVDPTITQATFSGTGNLGTGHNYIFIATISDPDKTGNHDTFSITVTDSTGNVVYTNSGTVKGHIEIHKFSDKDGKSDSNSQHDNNDHGKNSK